MDFGLSGKTVLVAGASRGIGLGIAESCLAEGASLALTARGEEALAATAARLAEEYGQDRVWHMSGDMRDSATIVRAIDGAEQALGPLWGAVANVGIHPCPFGMDIDDATWDAGFNQNLGSAWRLAREAHRRMKLRGEGALLFISSISGSRAMGTPLTYGTAKAAVDHLSREVARLVATDGLRANCIAPGNIIFPGGDWEARSTGSRKESWLRWLRREVPMQRFGQPEEIGSLAAFLLSPRASFITGAVIPIDGGQSA